MKDVIRRKTTTTVFKSDNNLAPTNLRNVGSDLLIPMMKTNNGEKKQVKGKYEFVFHEAKIWNELFCEAKQAPLIFF